ncbi:phospholipase/Carboxylesterase [Lentisphaera araneosa HTCC2155]|jgi:predicted peptidase|uniref:Phospholipase/Carboxylesterase n=1 Tax=Lentisphaera araneosa HTCC2155 TaxID=313628 RepID=A6DQW8_9BACT|nr:dienelactone hydrolase family protein [Lentisphaera araneosa]EDM26018.1 phospholipase/Carboxylesterase [Lentisphaera araneosa HTCC2155]
MRFLLIFFLICTKASADFQIGQLPQDVHQKTKCLNKQFLISKPKNSKPQPVFIFLHGIGKRGSEINKLKSMGKLILKNTAKYDMLTILPQCSINKQGKGWWDSQDLNLLLDYLKKTYKVDDKRIYLCGFSMGGFGTWDWAMASPKTFAAIAPIAGGSRKQKVAQLKELNIWTFHGKKDQTVKYEKTKLLVDALLKLKSTRVKFTSYESEGHGIVMQTLKNPELYKWFTVQSK